MHVHLCVHLQHLAQPEPRVLLIRAQSPSGSMCAWFSSGSFEVEFVDHGALKAQGVATTWLPRDSTLWVTSHAHTLPNIWYGVDSARWSVDVAHVCVQVTR